MPESPEDLYARVVALVGEDGRLPTPDLTADAVFPWEVVDGRLESKVLRPPVDADGPREGADPDGPCAICEGTLPVTRVWENDRFFLSARTTGGLPLVLFLQTRAHLDYPDMDDDLAGECGRLSARLCRIIEDLPHVGRAHVCRWGDGSAHHHVWFIARPARTTQVLGMFAVAWDDLLPPAPEEVRHSDLHEVAARLASYDGQALV